MNCANHPERPATAFCQNCGKALCPECTRSADGLILCEPCLLLRHPQAQTAASGHAGGAAYPPQAGYATVAYTTAAPAQAYSRSGASPVLAGLLGFIPGVGAMYNGQFVKAFIHVAVFAVLVGLAEHFDAAGILIAAWVFYQVFDAAQTAAARRDGRPLPDPFGILDLSRRIGPPPAYTAPYTPAPASPPPVSPPPPTGLDPQWSASYAPVPAVPARRGEPVGALVLIAVGLLLLMSTLGLFDVDWIRRLWPLALLLLGVWLLVRRARSPYPAAAPQTAAPVAARSPFSIAPEPERNSEAKGDQR